MGPHLASLAASIALLLLAARGAHAEPVVTWEAPAGCPDQAELLAAIEAELGGPVPDGVALAAVVERVDRRWTVTIRDGAGNQRTLEAATCAGLASATALVMAVAIGEQQASAPAQEVAPAAAAPTLPAMEPPVIGRMGWEAAPRLPVPRAAPRARAGGSRRADEARPLAVRLRVVGGVDAGTFNLGVAPGYGVAVELDRGAGHLRVLDLGLSQWQVGSSTTGAMAPAMTTATVRGCGGQIGARRHRLVCGGVEVSRVDAYGYDGVGTARGYAVGLQLGGALTRRLIGGLHLRADASLSGMIVRPRFAPAPDDATPAPLVARLFLGVEATLR